MRALPLLLLLGCRGGGEGDPGGGADGATDGGADGASDSPPAGDDSGEEGGEDACEPVFPPLAAEDTGGADDSGDPALPEVDPTGLLAAWPLDGDWTDSVGDLDLVALRAGGFAAADVARAEGEAYGPTGETSDNGALSAANPTPSLAAGLTMEGWYYKPDNNTTAVLFGFGGSTWGDPKLNLQDAWGVLSVVAGKTGSSVSFPRPTNGCWHHLALVLPPGFDSAGGAVTLYVDGVAATPSSGDGTLPGGLELFGGPFTAGAFSLDDGAAMRLDELRLWERALEPDEVAIEALARGPGEVCPSVREPWEPGPRCVFAEGDRPAVPTMETEVRVLDDRTLLVLADPSPWLYGELDAHCGAYLAAMEEHADEVEDWWFSYQYHFALSETLVWAWSTLRAEWEAPEAWRVAGCGEGEEASIPAETIRWLTPTREARIPRLPPSEGEEHDSHAERLLVGWLRLPWAMREGGTYAVQDRWGNEQSFVFSSAETLSWAIKLNQLGGPADHPGRRALIGAWLGPGGALDLSDRAGDPFTVVDEASGEVVLEGALGEPREAAEAGESLLQVDLSALTEPGRYHLEVPGVGRSWSFELGDDALGEAFYVHARGLYHNRCAPLEAEITPWARGDIHVVHQGGFPPDDDDYDDHADEGWGILDGGGGWVSLSHFDVVEATATDTVLPVTGGWHDAGDYDRRPQHLGVVEDLLVAWELAPASFSDGQLDLPESGNGRPDLVDEALFGLSMWRSAQAADGGVGTWVEATSHPKEADPGLDTQPYYLSLATRDSSLAYAREAARAARLLAAMGDPEAEDWLESALRAWDFALDPAAHPARSFTVDGEALRFVERPEADAERRLWAAIELRLATGDPVWDDVLLDLEGTYRSAVGNLWWQQRFARVADVVLHEDELPAGWGETARDALLEQAEVWLAAEEGNDYPWAWYDDTHAYHTLWGWGQGRWRPLVDLTLAWRLTGDERYRTGALLGVDGLLGLNPQGRVDTTGLGQHRAVTALHLPSWADDIDEPSPGIPLYGALPSVAWQASQRVWGYEEGARSSPDFDGAAISLLPPPWSADTSIDEVDAALEATLPLLRREVLLEASRPEEMEFAVFDSTSPAVLVTGLLLGPGWTPGAELRGRGPLDAAALRQDLWATP